jgi:hypothetical protein
MLHDDHHLSDKMTVVIKKVKRNDRREPTKRTVS